MAHAGRPNRAVRLLGGAGLFVDGAPAAGRASHRHPLALIALLVAHEGRPLSREKLMAYLWPERDTDSARNLLKVALHEVRKELGEDAAPSTGDQVRVDPSAVQSDLRDFLAAASAGDHAATVASYGGPFLDGFFLKDAGEFERWADAERMRYAGMFARALEQLALAADARSDLVESVRLYRRLADHEPFRADIAERLIRALAAGGNQGAAIQFAEAYARRRSEELGLDDDGGLMALARTAPAPRPGRETPAQAAAAVGPAAPGSSGSPSTHRRGRSLSIAAVAVTLLAGVVAVGLWRSRSGTPPPASGVGVPLVAVAPFRGVADDTAHANGEGLVELIAARFTGEFGPRAVDPRIAATAWRGAPASGGSLTLDQSMRVARQLGASQLVTGETVRTGDSTEISARLYRVSDGTVLATAAVDGGAAASSARLADQLVALLMARGAGEPADRLEELAGRPIAAVRPYLAAEKAYASSRYAVAESLYARALDADSTFAGAGLGLAMANSWTVINEHYGRGRDVAIRYRQALSARDRAFSNAFFGPDPALGPPKPAPAYLSAWEDVTEKWPDWPEAWYQLGDRYYHYGALSGLPDPLDRARTAFRRALAQDSTLGAPLHHLVELYAARGELADLRQTATRYFAANPGVDRDRSTIGWEEAMALGDRAWLARLRADMPSMPREDLTRIGWVTDANGWPAGDAVRAAELLDRTAVVASEHEKSLILLYALSLNAGHPAEARVAAGGLGAVFPDRPVAALWDLFAALFGGDGVDSALARDASSRLARFVAGAAPGDHVERDQHHLSLCLVGYRQALQGDGATAEAELARLERAAGGESNGFARRNADVCAAMLSARLAVQAHARGAATEVARLDTVLLSDRVPPHAILEAGTLAAAQLHAALGDSAAALIAARRREHLTGDPLVLSTELLTEARLSAALHDVAGAERAYRQFLALQASPEPGTPTADVARVRSELARVEGGR